MITLTLDQHPATSGVLHSSLIVSLKTLKFEILERVKKAATNLVPKLRKFSYPGRLKKLGITSLKERRLRGDMIDVYKLLTGKEHIDYTQFFELAENHYGVRGHEKKLTKDKLRLDTRKYFFSQRLVNGWNSLQAEVVSAESVNSFKNAYDHSSPSKTWMTKADQLASPSIYKYK